MEVEEWVRKLPKAELHVHLEGTLEPQLFFRFAKRNGVEVEFKNEQEVLERYEQLENLTSFLDLYYKALHVLQKEEDFYELTLEYLKKCAERENIEHVEAFFDPQAHTSRGIKFHTVISGIYRAFEDGEKQYGITFRLIMCIVRDKTVESAMETLESALQYKDKIAAIGLDSDEIGHPPSKFEKVFERAHKEGFLVVGHGGHDGPPRPYISELISSLKVQRIDHGVRCVEDPELVKEILEKKIPFTVCPISNVKIGPYEKMEDHPVKKMIELGLNVCINSDDPAYLRAYITDNLVAVAKAFQLSKQDIIQLIHNSYNMSFMNTQQKVKLSMLLQQCSA